MGYRDGAVDYCFLRNFDLSHSIVAIVGGGKLIYHEEEFVTDFNELFIIEKRVFLMNQSKRCEAAAAPSMYQSIKRQLQC
jgi:hypothetical protein